MEDVFFIVQLIVNRLKLYFLYTGKSCVVINKNFTEKAYIAHFIQECIYSV
ncbi:hypothetical protein MCU_00338 [Bartonella elizabethae Re6043vi]|uniref:Uncharacterized protein n=2 Tax=Bartonella elizabethae TaxID=807 RepID=J0RAS4_BAREL|nr:hypothetical protein MCU_00338 [Bartonella elizabethae Re6043vi]EJF95806.1 hypothetical protein MEE_01043 [Bartonella elizabethae F9251 = ATCC 49927]VEJ41219.1 Uncharacterised protein [Bartonella elizabethae]